MERKNKVSTVKRHKKHSAWHQVKVARVVVALVMLAAMTALFTTVEGYVATSLGWVAKLQIMPLAISGAITAIIAWFAATLLFGRIYCSWVCPMGIVQDFFAHAARITRKLKFKHRYSWHTGNNRMRYTWLGFIAIASALGLTLPITLFDPYSAYGRVASQIIVPIKSLVTPDATLFISSLVAFGIAVATLLVVGWTAYHRGRLVCNTVCPVGSLLSLISKYSLLHFDIDTDLCVNCRKCEHVCKAECINPLDHVVDSSRCVMCFNCVDACEHNAIRYTVSRKRLSIPMMQPIETAPTAAPMEVNVGTDSANANNAATRHAVNSGEMSDTHSSSIRKVDRRQFLATGLIVAAAPALLAADTTRRRIEAITNNATPLPELRPVIPPGAESLDKFLDRCTGCGLCVARCPAHVLRPSTHELGWSNMLHPIKNYDKSYCRYNCTRCTEVCPTAALMPLTEAEKHSFVVGTATVEADNCIGCGLCASRCPRKAIEMKSAGKGRVATVDRSLCIGCGSCQYICPATPEKAIGVCGIA
jgi:polyferredoxin